MSVEKGVSDKNITTPTDLLKAIPQVTPLPGTVVQPYTEPGMEGCSEIAKDAYDSMTILTWDQLFHVVDKKDI